LRQGSDDRRSAVGGSFILIQVHRRENRGPRNGGDRAGRHAQGPCIVGEDCYIASYAYMRGGVWLESRVAVGPSAEVKSSFICDGSKIAHLNFVGNSIIGRNVNIEVGAILANYRNEHDGGEIICFDGQNRIGTGQDKFGALVGDGCRIGANAVLAPGTILARGIVERLSLVDRAAARQ
jgi:bifunctional N-acetylglucosamine-1-phosphate-uridyltransferase/glucosamine-1-phosphate-acetyltransferase GlmU-like protein